MSQYTAVSLFSGIGGIDLAASLVGFDVIAQVEIDDYCRKVLTKHAPRYWPNATQFTDVCGVGSGNLPNAPDLLFGGFPCQDVSVAGKRRGIQKGTRSGLWLEFRRIIGEIRPRIVLLENVPGILTRDGTGVIADLAQMGYVGHWGTLSASEVGAPHTRERWFCVAYARSIRRWHNAGGQKAGTEAITSSTVANARILRFNTGRAEQSLQGARPCRSAWPNGTMVNTSSTGREKRNAATFTDQSGYVAGKRHAELGDSQRSGLTGKSRRRAETQLANGHTRDGGQFKPRLGRNHDGVSGGVDFPGFPAPPRRIPI